MLRSATSDKLHIRAVGKGILFTTDSQEWAKDNGINDVGGTAEKLKEPERKAIEEIEKKERKAYEEIKEKERQKSNTTVVLAWSRTGGESETSGDFKLPDGKTGNVKVISNIKGTFAYYNTASQSMLPGFPVIDIVHLGKQENKFIELEFTTKDGDARKAEWLQFVKTKKTRIDKKPIDLLEGDWSEANGENDVYHVGRYWYVDSVWKDKAGKPRTPEQKSPFYSAYGLHYRTGMQHSIFDLPSGSRDTKGLIYEKEIDEFDTFLLYDGQVVCHVHWELHDELIAPATREKSYKQLSVKVVDFQEAVKIRPELSEPQLRGGYLTKPVWEAVFAQSWSLPWSEIGSGAMLGSKIPREAYYPNPIRKK